MSEVIALLREAGVECYTRREWGSPREADGSYTARRATHPIYGVVAYHFLHIAVVSDTDAFKDGAERARVIEGYGYSTPPMVSYQMLVTNEGRVFEGQSYGVKGTHTVNDKGVPGFPNDLNREGYAVSLMQDVQDPVTDIQVDVAARCFAAAELAGYVRVGAPIFPHRKFAQKACPGDLAVARLGEIQDLKDHYVKNWMDDTMSAPDVWNEPLAEYDDDTAATEVPARVLLAQAHRRAKEARQMAAKAVVESRKVNRGIEALAVALEGLVPGVRDAVREALEEALPEVIEVEVSARPKPKN